MSKKDALESYIIERFSPDSNWLIVFEDDNETGYLYFCSYDKESNKYEIIDHLWIYNQINPTIHECENVNIIWSTDSKKVCFLVDGECWGIIDLNARRKLFAPREDGCIKSIERQIWEHGLQEHDGEELRVSLRRRV